MGRLRCIGFCVLAGTAVNVAIAWMGAAWGQVGPAGVAPPGAIGVMQEPTPPELKWRTHVPSDWGRPDSVIAAQGPLISIQWASSGRHSAGVIRTGWPARSMRATLYGRVGTGEEPPKIADRLRAGVDLPVPNLRLEAISRRTVGEIAPGVPQVITTRRLMPMLRRLPLEPLSLGFVGNSGFYAAGLGVMLWMLFNIRFGARLRRGRCEWCGYSRSGLGPERACPECGRYISGKGVSVRPPAAGD